MLAQSFMSAADLGITEPQRDALQKTLVLLETKALTHVPTAKKIDAIDWDPKFAGNFNMRHWQAESGCGTICCIGGTAELVGGIQFRNETEGLRDLFQPQAISISEWDAITPAQAARALRSYLTSGDAKWAEAVALPAR